MIKDGNRKPQSIEFDCELIREKLLVPSGSKWAKKTPDEIRDVLLKIPTAKLEKRCVDGREKSVVVIDFDVVKEMDVRRLGRAR